MEFKNPKTKAAEMKDKAAEKNEAAPASDKITVICGIHSLPNLNVAGKTVGEVRKKLTVALNINEDMNAVVNGKQVNGDHILKAEDTLEFIKHAGSKG